MRRSYGSIGVGIVMFGFIVWARSAPAAEPYKIVNSAKVGGEGGFDFVVADSAARRLYIPRSAGPNSRVTVYDLDTLKSVGEIPNTNRVHGVVIDAKSGHGFTSSKPVVLFDANTLATIKTIDVQGNPDEILFDSATGRVFVFSHAAPNATVLNSSDGSVVDTIDLGGAPEQAVSDGHGKVYVALEDKDQVAVVDAKTLKVTAHYDLGDKGGAPSGLALDAKNHILFACCSKPQAMVVLNADDGKIITSLPIGSGVDAAEFNSNTMEAFSSQRDGTLTVVKENSPTDFVVEQTVETKFGAKTSTLDTKTNQIYLISADAAPPPTPPADGKGGPRIRRNVWLPNSFTIIVVGK